MAYALRQPGYEVDMAGVWSTPAEKVEVVRWVQGTRDSLQTFAHGVYVKSWAIRVSSWFARATGRTILVSWR